MNLLDRIKDSDVPGLKRLCKEIFWLWLTTNDSTYLVSFRSYFNLLNQYLQKRNSL